MHTPTNEQVLEAEAIKESFIVCGARLPEIINKRDALVIGFADECYVRQSAEFFALFEAFLRSIGEESFFFLWLDASSDDVTVARRLSVHGVGGGIRQTNFVRLQSSMSDEVLAGEAWFVSSPSGRWAIYGEQYGSEIAVFLTRDEETAHMLRFMFKEVLSNASKAAADMGDPSETDEGDLFSVRLRANYSS